MCILKIKEEVFPDADLSIFNLKNKTLKYVQQSTWFKSEQILE